jgi:hypothetical protein
VYFCDFFSLLTKQDKKINFENQEKKMCSNTAFHSLFKLMTNSISTAKFGGGEVWKDS